MPNTKSDRAVPFTKVRFPVGWFFLLYFAVITATLAVTILSDSRLRDSRAPSFDFILFSGVIAIMVSFAIAFVLSLYYSYRFDPNGVRGVTYTGAHRRVEWSQLKEVRRTRGIEKLKYLFIPTTLFIPANNRFQIYVFTPMVQLTSFQDAIEKYAPNGSAARAFLAETNGRNSAVRNDIDH